MKHLLLTSGAILLSAAFAQNSKEPASGFRWEFLQDLNDTEKKVVSLAEVIPAEKYSWRPGPGVRSISEVYMHIAGANYALLNFVGVKPPAGVSRDMEKTVTKKEDVVPSLKKSFGHVRETVMNIPDADLDKQVKMFGRSTTERKVLFTLANHMHEHLGQLIAYARVNGIVPPWSAGKGE